MGLGLSISKKSLDDIVAEINFESKLKVGTKVKINFKINKHI